MRTALSGLARSCAVFLLLIVLAIAIPVAFLFALAEWLFLTVAEWAKGRFDHLMEAAE